MVTNMLTIQQIMAALKVSDETVYRYIRSGRLAALRAGGLWRVDPAELEKFLATNASAKK